MKIVKLILGLLVCLVSLYSNDQDQAWFAQQKRKDLFVWRYDYAKYLNFSTDYPASYYGIRFRIQAASDLLTKSEDLYDRCQQSREAIGSILALQGGTPFDFKMFESAKQREARALELVTIGRGLVANLRSQ